MTAKGRHCACGCGGIGSCLRETVPRERSPDEPGYIIEFWSSSDLIAFWCPKRSGRTLNLDEAGVYTFREYFAACGHVDAHDRPSWAPKTRVDAQAHRAVCRDAWNDVLEPPAFDVAAVIA